MQLLELEGELAAAERAGGAAADRIVDTMRNYMAGDEPSQTPFPKTSVKHCGTTSKNATLKGFMNWTENSSLGEPLTKLSISLKTLPKKFWGNCEKHS